MYLQHRYPLQGNHLRLSTRHHHPSTASTISLWAAPETAAHVLRPACCWCLATQPAQRHLVTLGKAQLQQTSHSFSHMLRCSTTPCQNRPGKMSLCFFEQRLYYYKNCYRWMLLDIWWMFCRPHKLSRFGWDKINFLSICSVYELRRELPGRGWLLFRDGLGISQQTVSNSTVYQFFGFGRFFPPEFYWLLLLLVAALYVVIIKINH